MRVTRVTMSEITAPATMVAAADEPGSYRAAGRTSCSSSRSIALRCSAIPTSSRASAASISRSNARRPIGAAGAAVCVPDLPTRPTFPDLAGVGLDCFVVIGA